MDYNNLDIIQRKQHCGKSGIYVIHNRITDKVYIGSASDLVKRRDSHLSYLRNGKHSNTHIQRSWNKYGKINFTFYCLEIIDRESLRVIEQKYLDEILFANCNDERFSDLGYNIPRDAERPNLGKTLTDKHKKMLSESRIGSLNPMYGKKLSQETRDKVSRNNAKYWLGRTHSEESKKENK